MFDENVEKESTSPPPKIKNIKNELPNLKIRNGGNYVQY